MAQWLVLILHRQGGGWWCWIRGSIVSQLRPHWVIVIILIVIIVILFSIIVIMFIIDITIIIDMT